MVPATSLYPSSSSRLRFTAHRHTSGDGLRLLDATLQPPSVRSTENKPSPEEIAACAPYLDREFAALRNVKVVVVLGKIAFERVSELPEAPRRAESKAAFLSATAKHISFRMDIPCYVRIILHCKTR